MMKYSEVYLLVDRRLLVVEIQQVVVLLDLLAL
jgi:hypothetical protein